MTNNTTPAKKIIDMIHEVEYSIDTDVHTKHEKKVDDLLKAHGAAFKKTQHTDANGMGFLRYNFRPEYLPFFHSMCVDHDKDCDGDDPIQTGGLAQIAGVSPGSMGGDGSSTGGGGAIP